MLNLKLIALLGLTADGKIFAEILGTLTAPKKRYRVVRDTSKRLLSGPVGYQKAKSGTSTSPKAS